VVPEKLQVRNFMCYGEDVPPLPFAGLHVTSISGQNGAGKSALLDALTWALWGKARGKSDDDLIRLGQEEMEVSFEFMLDQQLYRVIRRRRRAKRAGVTTLDFQVCERDGSWRRLTGDTVTETQETINRALRIEYDTFINSAFLLQGRADEFTGRKPAERKQVLADILGLDAYEDLERRAKETANALSKDLDVVQSYIERLRVEVELRPVVEQRLAEVREQAALAEENLNDYEAGMHELREQAARLRELSVQRSAVQQTIERLAAELHELHERMVELEADVQLYETTIARQAEIEQGVAQLQAIQAELDEMEQRREEAYRLNDEFKRWKSLLDDLRRALESEQRDAANRLAHLDEQLAKRGDVLAEREQLAQQIAESAAWQAELTRLRAEAEQVGERRTEILELQVQVKELQGVINVQRDSLLAAQQEHQRQARPLEAQSATLPTIERQLRDVHSQLLQLQALDDELATRREELAEATQRQGELQAENKAIEAAGKELNEKLRLLEHDEAHCPVCESELGAERLAHITAEYHQRRSDLREQISAIRRDLKANDALIAEQRAAIAALETTLAGRAQAEARQATLQLQQSQASAAAEQLEEVTSTLATLDLQLTQRRYALPEQRQLARVEAQLAELGSPEQASRELTELRTAIGAAERQLEQARKTEQRVARIDAELAALAAIEVQRPDVQARYDAISARLEAEDYGADERRELEAVRAAGQALGYRKEEHAALRELLETLRPWAREAIELERALGGVALKRDQLQLSRERMARIEAELAHQRQQLAELQVQLHSQPQIEQELRSAELRGQQLRQRLAMAQNERGSAEAELRRCDQQAETLTREQARAATLTDERSIYEELAQAFGKKGIQAMLIETAIPELEHEANELLSRMTDNQFHLAFETQRDTKKGDSTIETLDIRISDSLGTRDYQMFSGGEAFRVNFAIRIALSKLLARRAGASLKTLVIDEGFGTQDGAGRDRIVEAINSIQPDFERILVITHIQELKEMFESQIEVTKTLEGSTWSIS
jgi:exonuclease SbcC